jgi:hypothetical protein
MKRYTAGKYIKSDDALYDVLHKKHSGISKADFEITVSIFPKQDYLQLTLYVLF